MTSVSPLMDIRFTLGVLLAAWELAVYFLNKPFVLFCVHLRLCH